MDVARHVEHWKSGSEEDMEVAGENLERGRCRFALFLVHLALEKALKAHVTRATQDVPPRIHDLGALANKARIHMTMKQLEVLNSLKMCYIEGRYPDMNQAPIPAHTVEATFQAGKELWQWLMAQL